MAQSVGDGPFRDYSDGSFEKALKGAHAALEGDPRNPVWWALVAESNARLDRNLAAADAFAQAASFEQDADKRSYFLRAQALQLVYADRAGEARAVVARAMDEPLLAASMSLDWAMVAISAGDDISAQAILANEALYERFTRQTALDAGYSAKRVGLDARASRFFALGLALDAADAQPLAEGKRESVRREIRELDRSWSLLAQASYSSAGSPLGLANPSLGTDEVFQTGAEIAWRIGGWRNGRPLSVFARGFHSETLGDPQVAGNASQGWLGVRYKPLSTLNLNIEASRLVALDSDGLDDWSARAAISGGQGLEPQSDRRGWAYAHFYGDVSYLAKADAAYGVAEVRGGYAMLLDRRATTLTPYGVTRLGLDTVRAEQHDFGGGVGVSLRHWFDETEMTAYRGFIDLDVQARQRISGDDRASGILATITVGR